MAINAEDKLRVILEYVEENAKVMDNANKRVKEMDGGIKGLAKSLTDVLPGGMTQFLGVAGAVTALTGALTFSVGEAMEAGKVQAQLDAVLRSTGGAAGLTAAELDNMATELSRLTTYDDEAVKSTEALLLTFTSIGKDVFPDAMGVILDMSTALGQDLKSSAIQVGKALQDPIQGVSALRRVGVNFNEAQEKVIKNLVETGKQAEAQRYIIAELTKEFGGSAQAAAGTYAGQLQQLKNEVGNLAEAVGEDLLPDLQLLVTDIKNLTIWVTDNADAIKEWGNRIIWLTNPIGKLGEETGKALRDMLGLDEQTQDTDSSMQGAGAAANDFSGELDGLSDSAEDAADAEKEAAKAAKELTAFYKGMIGSMQDLKGERESFTAESEKLRQEEQELRDELVREQLAIGELTRERGKLTEEEKKTLDVLTEKVMKGKQLTDADYEQLEILKRRQELASRTNEQIQEDITDQLLAIDEVNKKLEENAEAQKQLTEDTQEAIKQRIADTVLERLSKDELTSEEYEFFQNYLVQQGLITAADRDRTVAISQVADQVIADYERQHGVLDTTQQKLDALVNGSPYNVDINIETHGSIPTISSGTPSSGIQLHPSATSGANFFGGYQHGGSFIVPGAGNTDSQLVAFRATPGEEVNITPKGGRSGASVVNNFYITGVIDQKMINLLSQEITKVQTR